MAGEFGDIRGRLEVIAEELADLAIIRLRESIDAGSAFGFYGRNLYLRIILPQVVLAAIPMIGNQSIQVIKDTAFLMIIAVPELTHAASSIQSKYYVPFAAFISAVALYWAMCSVIEAGVRRVERIAEVRR